MKRFLTILFIAGGLVFAHSLSAQTSNPKAGGDTLSNKKTNAGTGDAKPGSGSDIAVDENGTTKPKHKAKAKSGNPNRESAKGGSSDDVGSPADIAIDESGTSRPKAKPKANTTNAPDPPPAGDTSITSPASQVGRPQR